MTAKEQVIHQLMQSYQYRYFKDMSLRDSRIIKQLATIYHEDGTVEIQDLQEPGSLDILYWKVRIRTLQGFDGRCDEKKRTIYIQHGLQGELLESAVLHEMIHAYEVDLWSSHRDWLLLWLYRILTKKIGPRKLHNLINDCLFSAVRQPAHSVLFLLKSLDLDLRCNKPMGFVFGYGRDGLFTHIKMPKHRSM